MQAEEASGVPRCFARIDAEALKDTFVGEAQLVMTLPQAACFTLCLAGQRCVEFLDEHIALEFRNRLVGQVVVPPVRKHTIVHKRKQHDSSPETHHWRGGKHGRPVQSMQRASLVTKRQRELEADQGGEALTCCDVNTYSMPL